MSLEAFDTRFHEGLKRILDDRGEKVDRLREQYLMALTRVESQLLQQGDARGVTAVRTEMERVRERRSKADEEQAPHPEVVKLRGVIDAQSETFRLEQAEKVDKLVDAVRPFAARRAAELTRLNQVEEALGWQNWLDEMENQPLVRQARGDLQRVESVQAPNPHPALTGRVAGIQDNPAREFPASPALYRAGAEPQGKGRRVPSPGTPSIHGAGYTVLIATLKLMEIDERVTETLRDGTTRVVTKSRFVPRLEFSPLINTQMGKTLVVFDFYGRGSGSRRFKLRSDRILLPPFTDQDKVVVDAGFYENPVPPPAASTAAAESAPTADSPDYYGFIVSMFDENGRLIYQRTSERILNDQAPTAP